MEALYTQYENQECEFRYHVYWDDIEMVELKSGNAICFGSSKEDKEAEKEYIQRFLNGEFGVYWIVKEKVCDCCRLWSVCDSLGGIHAESPKEALKVFKEGE